MAVFDRNNKEILDGDIINIHQTVNGCNTFVVHVKNLNGDKVYSASYYMSGRDYEYDVMDLLRSSHPFDDVNDVEIIGNIHKGGVFVKVN